MIVKKITPRGFCHGVVDSINICKKVVKDPSNPHPIYMLGLIVHNRQITNELQNMGIKLLTGDNRLEMLEKVNTGTVIITAHGTSKEVFIRAKKKGLNIIDTTCSEVYVTHDLIEKKINDGYTVLYISQNNHPEQEGVKGISSENLIMIEEQNVIDQLPIDSNIEKICVTNQTTMNMFKVNKLIIQLKEKFPNIEVYDEICTATKQRQNAVIESIDEINFLYVIGDPKSNNSQQLVKISLENNVQSQLISTIDDLVLNDLDPNWVIGVTSGASTPSNITKTIINYLEQVSFDNKETFDKTNFYPTRII